MFGVRYLLFVVLFVCGLCVSLFARCVLFVACVLFGESLFAVCVALCVKLLVLSFVILVRCVLFVVCCVLCVVCCLL